MLEIFYDCRYCCCCFFISTDLLILLAATVLVIIDGTNRFTDSLQSLIKTCMRVFVSLCVMMCVHMIPLNGYETLSILWYATVSNGVHIFYDPITCSRKCFVILFFLLFISGYFYWLLDAHVFLYLKIIRLLYYFCQMIEYFRSSELMMINTHKKRSERERE